MTAAQEGDEEAYESLLGAILPLLRTITARRLGDPSSVEDVVQTVLLSIHRRRIEATERAGTSPGALKVHAHRGYTALHKLLRRLRG